VDLLFLLLSSSRGSTLCEL